MDSSSPIENNENNENCYIIWIDKNVNNEETEKYITDLKKKNLKKILLMRYILD